MSRVVAFAAWTACTTGWKVIRGQREGEREQRQKEEEVEGRGIGELLLSAGKANKETAAVLIAEFSTRVEAGVNRV